MSGRIFRQIVPVEFNGKHLYVKNVTKYTTCDDVVHMLLLKVGIPIEQLSSYALFEATGDLERMLPGRTRILKTLWSWGCEKDNFNFVLRKLNADNERFLRAQFYDSSNGEKEVHIERSNFPLNIELDEDDQYLVKESLQQLVTNANTAENEHSNKSVNEEFNISDTKRKPSKSYKRAGNKQVLLKKYLSNLLPFKKSKRFTRKTHKVETDCGEVSKLNSQACIENILNESPIAQIDQFRTLKDRCRYYWNSNSESDDESDFLDELTFFRESDFNNAFLQGLTKANDDESTTFSVTDIQCGDLNDAFIQEHNEIADDTLLSGNLENKWNTMTEAQYRDSPSDISDCELDKNITSCDVVRNVFCGQPLGGAVSEDEEMDSFMRTHIYESDSEESII